MDVILYTKPSHSTTEVMLVPTYVRELCIDHLSAFVEKSLCLFTHFELHHLWFYISTLGASSGKLQAALNVRSAIQRQKSA